MREARTMYHHAINFILYTLVSFQLLNNGSAAEKSIAGINGNIELNRFPASIKDFGGSQILRAVITDTIGASSIPASSTVKPKTTSKPKATRLMTSTTRKPRTIEPSPATPQINEDKLKFKPDQRPEYPQLDSARAAQNQFPFDIRNNFNFPEAGSQLPFNGRRFNDGFFGGNQGISGNPEYSRSFSPFGSPGYPQELRGNENAIQPGGSGRNPANPEFQNGPNTRPFENLEDSDRFRNFQRFGYDRQFPEQFLDGFNSPFRSQDARFPFGNYPGGQNGQQDSRENNFRQNLRVNDYPNSLNNYRRFDNLPGSFPFPGYAPNNFDFLPNQRFQNPSEDNFRRPDLSNFQQFYPTGRNPGNSGVSRPSSPVSAPLGINSSNGSASGPLPAASKNSEKLENISETDRKNPAISTEAPVDFQGPRQFYPALDDYSDLRFRPDGGFFINSNIPAKRSINGKA